MPAGEIKPTYYRAVSDYYAPPPGYIDATDEVAALRAERDRVLSANDTLVRRIEDLTEGYATEDTCPRVQCLTTSRRLKSEVADLRAERDEASALANHWHSLCETVMAERDRWKQRAQTGDAIAQDCIDDLRSALRDTNDHIIQYGTNPDTYDWSHMTARTRLNAALLEATDE